VTVSTGIITTIAGSGRSSTGNIGDGGDATLADFGPFGVVVDSSGTPLVHAT